MFKIITYSVFMIKNNSLNRCIIRNYSFNIGSSIGRRVKKYFMPIDGAKPPYNHVCQIGDPVLRMKAEPVDLEVIPTAEFKQFVDHLISVMRKYEAFGLAASQIGVPIQVFVIETTVKNYAECIGSKCAGQLLQIVPLRIFINPKMKIIDYKTFAYPESCASICGYSAHVPRAKSIRIEALDIFGKSFVWDADGWPAKIAQHEMDHLQGKVYTDKMDPQSLSCVVWDAVNWHSGKIAINFSPIKKNIFKKLFFS